MQSKKIANLACVAGLAMLLVGCGNSQKSTKQDASSAARTSLVDYQLASSSASLDANQQSPKVTAALVLYYAGAENNDGYVKSLKSAKGDLAIDLYNAGSQPSSTGIKSSLPSGSQVVYYVHLNKNAATYYTIVGDQFYITDGHGGFKSSPVSRQTMTDLANKNKAGDTINDLADRVHINDDRNGGGSSNKPTAGEGMDFDKAVELVQKGGFTDFDYDRDSQTHDGSHATGDGYVMVTYPGAKGKDIYTITKTGKGKYHIEAQYLGSDDNGGYSPIGAVGPTSADVSD